MLKIIKVDIINKTNVFYNKKFLFSIKGKLNEIQIDTWKKRRQTKKK